MASLTMSHPMPTMLNLRPKRVKKQPARNAAYTPIPPMPSISSSRSSSSSSSSTTTCSGGIKKPMRPLTAYHIFFQIEREYIIQTTAGSDADPSMHNNKTYLQNVPRRYRSIKLLPDWYAGPGKRQKRKHRKSHGKIGFLELSRVISKRWATLDSTDPETKQFVSQIAARELGEYKVEMAEYKELTKHMEPSPTSTNCSAPSAADATPSPPVSTVVSSNASSAVAISPSSSPSPKYPSLSYNNDMLCQPCTSMQPEVEEIDYTICRQDNNGHYIPSRPSLLPPLDLATQDGSICDPLFELDEVFFEASNPTRRCVSPVSSSSSHSDVEHVDLVAGDDFFGLL